MRLIRFLYLLPFLIYITFAQADQLIIEPDMGRRPILDLLQQANHSVKLVMYGFTDQTLLDSLINQQTEGKNIEVILESQPYRATEENQKTLQALNKAHVPLRSHINPFRFIHQKTLIIDNAKMLVMTFNWTHSSFKNERNFALLIDDANKTRAAANVFVADWNQQSVKAITPGLIYSPHAARSALVDVINHSQTSLRIYAQTLSDYQIIGALAKASRRGVKVSILTSTPIRPKQATYLNKAGVRIFYNKKLYIHAKVFIVDNNLALVGSTNLTATSLDANRELLAATTDKTVINKLNQTFIKDSNGTPLAETKITMAEVHEALRLLKKIKKCMHTLSPFNMH